jgi:hypothetical protein
VESEKGINLSPANPTVNVTIADEIVHFGKEAYVATTEGDLHLDFILLYPSSITVSVKFTISDKTG